MIALEVFVLSLGWLLSCAATGRSRLGAGGAWSVLRSHVWHALLVSGNPFNG
eukprot:m.19098 g.19098  ORF g.19098 m.19098 type:complete len:52 (+) comp30667_c0_seq1:122-277(+)